MSNPDSDDKKGARPPLKLVGCYAADDGGQLEGDRQYLLELAQLLKDGPDMWTCELTIPKGDSRSPYDGFLTALRLEKVDDLVRISIEDTTLVIAGSNARLDILAENIEWLADSREADHLHFDYNPDHFYLAPSSSPLVLVLKRRQA